MEDARRLARHGVQLVDPDRMRDGRRLARQHLQVPHDRQTSAHERADVVRIHRAGAARLDRDRRLPARRRRAVEVAGRRGIGRPVRGDDDVVEAEREDHAARDVVELRVSGLRPVGVRAQVLVEVAAVQVDEVVAALHDLPRHREQRALGLRSVGAPRVETVHALAVHRIDVRDLLLERRDVHERDEDDGPRERRRIERRDQFLHRRDRRVLGAVRAGDERQHGPGPRAADHRDGDLRPRVRPGRNRDDAGRLRPGRRRSRSDRERRGLPGRAGRGRPDDPDPEERPEKCRARPHQPAEAPRHAAP
jgi:hypothetical protein